MPPKTRKTVGQMWDHYGQEPWEAYGRPAWQAYQQGWHSLMEPFFGEKDKPLPLPATQPADPLLSRAREALRPEPGYDYGELVPARRKPGGDLEVGLPGFVRDIGVGLIDLLEGKASEDGRSLTREGLSAAMTPAWKSAASRAGPSSQLNTFIGAKGADRLSSLGYPEARQALGRAEMFEKAGASPGEIWHETGAMRGADGQWRFEIPDNEMKLGGPGIRQNRFDERLVGIGRKEGDRPYNLPDIMEHQMLFDAYPELRAWRAQSLGPDAIREGTQGSINPTGWMMNLAGMKPGDMKKVLAHENQHIVQEIEGFAKGGNSRAYEPLNMQKFVDSHEKAAKVIQDKIIAAGLDPSTASLEEIHKVGLGREWASLQLQKEAIQRAKEDAYDTYHRLAGEVEARNVSNRLDMTEGQRRQFAPHGENAGGDPYWREDVPRRSQLINPSEVELIPIDGNPFLRSSGTGPLPQSQPQSGRKVPGPLGVRGGYLDRTPRPAGAPAHFMGVRG